MRKNAAALVAASLVSLGLVGLALASNANDAPAIPAHVGPDDGANDRPHPNDALAEDTVAADLAKQSILDPLGWDVAQPAVAEHEPPFELEQGSTPSRSDALDFASKYSRFIARGDEGIDELRAEGHMSGAGTKEDPYVLERFYVDGDLTIQSTHRALILREGYVEGQLSLNYVGAAVYVHHVYADDLRVNENVERSGENTGGLWHDNHFGFVGQIRHFIGEFRDNVVGPRPDGVVTSYVGDTGVLQVPEGVVFNFDGFHGADVHHNVFHGKVDIKLHGHNHGDCFTCPIHNHADESEFPDNQTGEEHLHGDELAEGLGFRSRHSVRYASLMFRDNEIHVNGDGWAIRYNDRNHAGDDQTANSEPNEYLEDNHVHFQDVTIQRNQWLGGGLLIEIFNADDERHPAQNRGILRVWDNLASVTFDDGASRVVGIDVVRADGVALDARENRIRFHDAEAGQPGQTLLGVLTKEPVLVGFELDRFDASNVTIQANVVESGTYGVYAKALADDVAWALSDNDFHTEHAWKGEDVANAPEES